MSALASAIFDDALRSLHRRTDRLFRWLLLAQWGFAVLIAAWLSPWTYVGDDREIHIHVWSALVLGGALCGPALLLIAKRPGHVLTRQVVTVTQMLFSALLIHLTGGRIETHFHIFGSLAFVAFYRDRALIGTATVMVTLDHLLRGMLWPESVYGVINPEWWRFLEHATWVTFEDVVLLAGIARAQGDLREVAGREASLTEIKTTIEHEVVERTAELAASRERYQTLVERTQAVVWEFLPDEGRCRYIAPQVEPLLGYPRAQYETTGFFYSVLHDDDAARVIAGIARARADGLDYQEELRFVAADGRIVHVRSMIAVEQRSDGTILRGVSIDITEQKLLEAELREAQKLESLARMAAGVAHEINTPLQYIGNDVEFLGVVASRLASDLRTIGTIDASSPTLAHERALEIVRRAKLPTIERRVPEALTSIHGGLRAVERIVGTLRNITGAHPLGPERPGNARSGLDIDLGASLTTLLASARRHWTHVDFELEFDATPGVVRGDAGTLALALDGLLRNAAEACTASGHADARVTVGVREADGHVEIRITDRGPGIPASIRDRIFDPFFTTKGVGHGSGEGLNRIRDIIVQGHDGELRVDTSGPGGTTLLVRLPTVRASTQAA